MIVSTANSIRPWQLAAGILLVIGCLGGCRSVVDSSQPLPLAESSDSNRPAATPTSTEHVPVGDSATERQIEAAEAVLNSTVSQRSENGLRPRKVDSRGWYLEQGVPLFRAVQQGKPRWRHAGLESLLTQSELPHEVFLAGSQSANAEVQATALIGRVRSGHTVAPELLADLVLCGKTASTTQAALIEALAGQKGPQSKAEIERLLVERDALVEAAAATDPAAAEQLEEQIWLAWATVTDSCRTDERMIGAFAESSPAVQSTLLDLMLVDRDAPLPTVVEKQFARLSPEGIRRLGLWEPYLRTVAPRDVLEQHVRSPDFRTRESALIGLGREGSPEAQMILAAVDDNDATLLQVAAVIAWGLIGEHDQWPRLAKADSWRVRQAVAQWVPLDDQRKMVIDRLRQDDTPQVRQAIEDRLQTHGQSAEPTSDPPGNDDLPSPADTAVPSGAMTVTPQEAVAILQWIHDARPAAEPESQAKARAELTTRPDAVLAALRLAARQFAGYDNPYLFQELLPSIDPAFQWLLDVGSHSESLSIRALRRLEQHSQQQPLHELALWRLRHDCEDFGTTQWDALLNVIRNDGRDPARQIAALALEHPAPQIRLAACQHVAKFPEGARATQIEASLQDEVPAVRVAAIEALVALADPAKDVVFVEMLTDRSTDVQLAAAHALDRLGEPRGVQHLYRMTYDASRKTRLLATQAIAARGQREDLHTLMRLLDDETPIRAAALVGLEKIVPVEEQPAAISERTSIDAKCDAWKHWFHRHRQTP